MDPRKARTKENYSLKDAKEDFRLWDKLYGREVLKHLEQYSKWEPGGKEKERRQRLAALEAKQVSIFRYQTQNLATVNSCFKNKITFQHITKQNSNNANVNVQFLQSQEENGEGLEGITEEAALTDDFAALKLKKRLANAKNKGKIPLPPADLQFCLTKTSLDYHKISQWYR